MHNEESKESICDDAISLCVLEAELSVVGVSISLAMISWGRRRQVGSSTRADVFQRALVECAAADLCCCCSHDCRDGGTTTRRSICSYHNAHFILAQFLYAPYDGGMTCFITCNRVTFAERQKPRPDSLGIRPYSLCSDS